MCIVFSSWCIDIFISKSILLNFKVVGDFLIPFIFVCFEMFFIFLIIFLLKDYCFTEFCCFLSNLNMNQPRAYIYPLPFGTPSPSHPSRLIQSHGLSFLSHTANSCCYLFYIWYCEFPCYSFHTSHPLLPSLHVHKPVPYVCF